MGFDFKVEYSPGHLNRGVDELSRHDLLDPQLHATSRLRVLLLDSIRGETQQHPELLELFQKIDQGTVDSKWTVKDCLIFYKNRIFLHHTSPLITSIVSSLHDSIHEGLQKTYFHLSRDFYWWGMQWMVADYVTVCQGTKLAFSSTYHPQSDGQTEIMNRTLEIYLWCFIGDQPKHWVHWLAWAEYCYNTSYHTALGTTPFRVVYGRDLPRLTTYEPRLSPLPLIDQALGEWDTMLAQVKANLQRAH
ncbi:uncharacterized protein [Aristolochia californica]|uniref:uncharacterized protein n=1 Tax=Aristolochia californica TaxID=171875 RepID=UPI0035E39530